MDDEPEPKTDPIGFGPIGLVGTEGLPSEVFLGKNNGFGEVMGGSDGVGFEAGGGRGGHRGGGGVGEVFGESE